MIHFLWHLFHPGKSCAPPVREAEISDAALCRQMLYDAFDEPERVAELVGLPAVSAEVQEMEQRAHIARLTAIKPVMPLLLGQSDFMGAAAAMLQCVSLDDTEHAAQVQAVFVNVIKASVIASVASAVDLGVLDVSMEVSLEQ